MAATLKEEGNKLVQTGDWKKALACYTQGFTALLTDPDIGQDAAKALAEALHANMSQCYLKQDMHTAAAESAGACLLLNPMHTKARYRRAVAFEKLGNSVVQPSAVLFSYTCAHANPIPVQKLMVQSCGCIYGFVIAALHL
eukprot:s282_g31.t1